MCGCPRCSPSPSSLPLPAESAPTPTPPTHTQVIDRILFKLDELVRPYCHKILVVIEPLLIDEDYYARVEGRWADRGLSWACWRGHVLRAGAGGARGQALTHNVTLQRLAMVAASGCSAVKAQVLAPQRTLLLLRLVAPPVVSDACTSHTRTCSSLPDCREIIANLSKAAGLATMIAAMRPDIDNVDEYVRNTTARAFSGGDWQPCASKGSGRGWARPVVDLREHPLCPAKGA